jgi:DNA-binding IclR family transcriptional regulator
MSATEPGLTSGEPAEQDYLVRSVLRAATLLRAVGESVQPPSLSLLSQRSGLTKATVFRLMRTLMEAGLVEMNPGQATFRLGPLCAILGQTYLDQIDVLKEARPILTSLRDQTAETVHLGILEGDQRVLYLEKLESTHAVGVMKSRVGATVPAYCTGIGKALLATRNLLPPEESLHRFTPATIGDPVLLKEELESVRSRGYALDLEEHEPGVRCVAVPVYGSDGVAVAAISVTGPSERMERGRLEGELLVAARAAASAISARLGWSGGTAKR